MFVSVDETYRRRDLKGSRAASTLTSSSNQSGRAPSETSIRAAAAAPAAASASRGPVTYVLSDAPRERRSCAAGQSTADIVGFVARDETPRILDGPWASPT